MQTKQSEELDSTSDFNLDTDEFAKRNGVKGQSVRARVSRTGSYFGVKPIRASNGRLRWPDERTTHSEAAQAAAVERCKRALAARQKNREVTA